MYDHIFFTKRAFLLKKKDFEKLVIEVRINVFTM